MKTVPFFVLTFACFLSACADPAAGKPKAQTAESSDNPAATPFGVTSNAVSAYKPSGTAFAIASDSSKIEFTGSNVSGSHDRGFELKG